MNKAGYKTMDGEWLKFTEDIMSKFKEITSSAVIKYYFIFHNPFSFLHRQHFGAIGGYKLCLGLLTLKCKRHN